MKEKLSIKNKYYKYFPFKFLVENLIKKRARKIVNQIGKFIGEEQKILDIGAGGGWVAKEIKKRKNIEITLLDVFDFNQTEINIVLYNGENMPFKNDSFNVSLLVFALHHMNNFSKVLLETKRVTRNRIIIFEDTYTSFINKILLFIWDVFSNLPSFLVKWKGENMPFNFKETSEWQRIFKELNLKIVFQKELKSKWPIGINKILFILEKYKSPPQTAE